MYLVYVPKLKFMIGEVVLRKDCMIKSTLLLPPINVKGARPTTLCNLVDVSQNSQFMCIILKGGMLFNFSRETYVHVVFQLN